MKKIHFSGIFKPYMDDFSEQDLKKMLKNMGELQIDMCEIEVSNVRIDQSYKPVWIYVSPDESDPYFLASLEDRLDLAEAETDAELSDEFVDALREHGICVGLIGQYPRADRYGVPGYVSDSMKGEEMAAFHGFTVTNDHFFADGRDSRDDSAEQVWFKVMVPIEKLNAELPELE